MTPTEAEEQPANQRAEAAFLVAALYVQTTGVYSGRDDVDCWPETRDARLYAGPHPVVAHPPCARWGRYWFGGPSVKVRKAKGDDGGCFKAALEAVEAYGGVLEHPAGSYAWDAFGILHPTRGAWSLTVMGGWTCEVEQGCYGHMARKATWLYLYGHPAPPPLLWGKSVALARLDRGFHSREERQRGRRSISDMLERLSHRQREATPLAFAECLLELARGCKGK